MQRSKRDIGLVFLDANIPMYLIGSDHPNKVAAGRLVNGFIEDGERLVTDAEVFQEILHRYTAIHRPEFIEPAFAMMRKVIDEVFPIDMTTVELARSILAKTSGVSAREAIHIASMEVHKVSRIASFDPGYDRILRKTRIFG
jgi:predicted nucleic acid-binding protein